MKEDKKINGKTIFLFLGLFFLLGGIVGGGYWWYQSSRFVTTDNARVSGSIVPVSSKIPGKVLTIFVNEGDAVQAGQVLAQVDLSDLENEKAKAEAAVAAAKARLENLTALSAPQFQQPLPGGSNFNATSQAQAALAQAQARLSQAERDYKKMETLFAQGAISAVKRNQAKASYESAEQNVALAQQNAAAAQAAASRPIQPRLIPSGGSANQAVAMAAAQLKQAEQALASLKEAGTQGEVIAPCDGIISLKTVSDGQVVAAGQSLFSLTQTGDLWINAQIDAGQINRLKEGQKVDYTVADFEGRLFTGELYEIGVPIQFSGDYANSRMQIPVKISVPEDLDVVFQPGMAATVKIYTKP